MTLGSNLHGPGLAVDVRTLGVGHVPVGTAVEPDVELELAHEVGDRADEVLGQDVLLEDLHGPVDDQAAVEGGDGRLQVQGIDRASPCRAAGGRW